MKRDKLLTKSAMELEEWPVMLLDSPSCYEKHGDWSWVWLGGSDRIVLVGEYDACIDKYHWHQRRTELINKPSWDDAPEWAEWLAQDKRGEWCFYPEKPEKSDDMWINDEPKTGIFVDVHCRGAIPAGHDWRETLEQRPFASVIKNTTTQLTDVMTPEEESIPSEQQHSCNRCGGSYYSPPHDECPCSSGRSDGSTASYYELPPGATELQDLISYRNLNAQDGEIFRAVYRKGRASHSDALRDAKKVLFYAEAEVRRLEAYGE